MKFKLNLNQISIKGVEDIYMIMNMILKRENKVDQCKLHFWIVALSAAGKILNLELIALGSGNENIIKPMDVLSIPLQKRATHIILVHNRSTGDLEPTEENKA